jgi:Tfp pilus assembly protein PilF
MSGRLLAVFIVLAVAGCGAKPVTAPIAPGAPHFPEFVFPAAPDGLATADVTMHHASAWQLLQGGDAKAAEREFTAILKLTPTYYPSEAGLGYAALARRDAGAAVTHFDKALAANPSYAAALAGKGDALSPMAATRRRSKRSRPQSRRTAA